MRNFLLILILTFSFQTLSKADDIRDFEIEGISIGDSLLDYYTKEQIKKFSKVTYPSSNIFIGLETEETFENKKFKQYDAMTFHVKNNDNNFEIFSIKGMLDYPNKAEECSDKKREITNEIKSNLNYEDLYSYESFFGKKLGKSIAYITDIDLLGGDAIRVWCTTWDKENKDSKYWIDTLNVSAGSKPFFDFLNNEAYK